MYIYTHLYIYVYVYIHTDSCTWAVDYSLLMITEDSTTEYKYCSKKVTLMTWQTFGCPGLGYFVDSLLYFLLCEMW